MNDAGWKAAPLNELFRSHGTLGETGPDQIRNGCGRLSKKGLVNVKLIPITKFA